MTAPRLTAAQRKILREHGPFKLDPINVTIADTNGIALWGVPSVTDVDFAFVAALNAIALEPEPVARAREALLRYLAGPTVEKRRALVLAQKYRDAVTKADSDG